MYRSGDLSHSGKQSIIVTGKQLQRLPLPPLAAAAIRIAAANSIAAASGAVPPETPLLTVSLRQIPSPGCWAGFQELPGRLRNTRH